MSVEGIRGVCVCVCVCLSREKWVSGKVGVGKSGEGGVGVSGEGRSGRVW